MILLDYQVSCSSWWTSRNSLEYFNPGIRFLRLDTGDLLIHHDTYHRSSCCRCGSQGAERARTKSQRKSRGWQWGAVNSRGMKDRTDDRASEETLLVLEYAEARDRMAFIISLLDGLFITLTRVSFDSTNRHMYAVHIFRTRIFVIRYTKNSWFRFTSSHRIHIPPFCIELSVELSRQIIFYVSRDDV